MLIALISAILGFVLLYCGAEILVKGSSRLGLRLGLSQLVIGLTIVAFGTSAPELAVSLNAAYLGQTDIAVGNVVGSNIANIGLILGLSALIRPLQVDVKLIRVDVPIMIGVSLLFLLMLLDRQIGSVEGAGLLVGLFIYTVFSVLSARKTPTQVAEESVSGLPARWDGWWLELLMVIAGMALLILGGRFLVYGAVLIARLAGISEAVIGLTVVAVGTSLPELATSLLATARNMGDISVGNIVGSNIFNILCVLGASALLAPLPMRDITWADIGVMLAFAAVVWPIMRFGVSRQRVCGVFLLVSYAGYLSWLALVAA